MTAVDSGKGDEVPDCRWIQLDSEYHLLALQYLLNLPVKINTQMGSNPFVFSVSMIILAAIAWRYESWFKTV